MARLYWKKLTPLRTLSLAIMGTAASTPTPRVEIFNPIPNFEIFGCPGLRSEGAGTGAGSASSACTFPPAASNLTSATSVASDTAPAPADSLGVAAIAVAISSFGAPPSPDPAKQFPLHPAARITATVDNQGPILTIVFFSCVCVS